MRRFLTVLLAGTLMLGLMAPQASASRWNNECRYTMFNGHRGLTTTEVKKTIACMAKKFGVSPKTALYVAKRESGFRPSARNSSSGACGLFQHISTDAWKGRFGHAKHARPRLKLYGDNPNCYQARANTAAAMWLAKHYGWSPWSVM